MKCFLLQIFSKCFKIISKYQNKKIFLMKCLKIFLMLFFNEKFLKNVAGKI